MSSITLTDNEKKYLTTVLESVRKEIEDSKERTFKIITGQVFALPIVGILSETISSQYYSYVFLIMPFIVTILVLTFIHEQQTVMRAGYYIRTKIEDKILSDSDNVIGWENFLEGFNEERVKVHKKIRKTDQYLRTGFWFLSATYYIFSIVLAMLFIVSPKINMQVVTQPYIWPPKIYTSIIAILSIVYLINGYYVFCLARKECYISQTDYEKHLMTGS